MGRKVIIVGGGITGLACAFFLRQRRPEWELVVLEREGAAGGKVRSSVREGFTVDWGPNGFLSRAPDTLELVEALGLGEEVQPAAPLARSRFLYHDGALRPLPMSPPAFLTSGLLSPWGKARAALEPLFGRHVEHEETVHAFLERHFGREVAATLAGAVVLGITAGDARRLSLDALFPRFRQLEAEHGSLLRALLAQGRSARTNGPAERPRLTSFRRGGLGRLSTALATTLAPALRVGAAATGLARRPSGGYTVALADGERLDADEVVLATPAFVSARLLEGMLPEAAARLAAIPYADVRVLALGFDRIDVPHPLDGFGFLAPRGQGVRALGVLWSSSLFPERSPEERVLLRVIAGGSVDPDFAALSDDEALAEVRRDLRVSMGITAEPVFVEGVRWPRGIPQYELGHLGRVRAVMDAVAALPGLHLAGNAFYGVGVNDCVRDARRVVERLAPE